MRRLKIQLFVGFIIACLTMVGYFTMPAKFQALDNQLRDYMFFTRGAVKPSSDVLIVDIDEKSLNTLGQWPWKRKKFAQVLNNLHKAEVGVIGLDIVFSEYDNSNPATVLKELGLANKGVDDYDAMLAQAVASTPTILGYVFKMQEDGVQTKLAPNIPAIFIERNKSDKEYLFQAKRALLNIPPVQNSAYSSGFFNTMPDDDSGIIRSVPLVMKYDGVVYPSLSMEMIRIMTQADKVFLNYGDDIGVQSIQSGDLIIPTDQFGRLLVNYRGPSFSYKYISALDIYNNTFDPKDIAGKFVLVGTSAAGLLDLRSMPFDNVYPGVEIHASVIDNILQGDFISKPSWVMAADMAHIFVVGFIISVLLSFGGAMMSLVSFVLLLSAELYFNYYMLFTQGIALNILFSIVILTISLFFMSITINYFLEIRQKNMIKRKFSTKVSADVMEDILDHAGSKAWDGAEKEITVFFSDVRGFTNISEAMGDAKSLIKLMNDIMKPMTEIIIAEKGTIDKYIGDAIMAYWNAPHDVDNHADRAVRASLKQLYALKELNQALHENPLYHNVTEMSDSKHIPIVDIGIGLNTGVAIVGEMGSEGRSDYTAIGDPVNLGARLESLCKYYNSRLNISNFTKAQLQGKYIYRFLDLVIVKGKSKPIEIWQIHDYEDIKERTLCGFAKEQLLKEIDYYHEAIALYKEAKFKEALEIFSEIENWEEKSNMNIYKIYMERCEHYLEFPPEDFNGVFTHTTKG